MKWCMVMVRISTNGILVVLTFSFLECVKEGYGPAHRRGERACREPKVGEL
jgi:hypothetical protein